MSIGQMKSYLKRALAILVIFCFLFLCSCKKNPQDSYYYEFESEVVTSNVEDEGSNGDSQVSSQGGTSSTQKEQQGVQKGGSLDNLLKSVPAELKNTMKRMQFRVLQK